MTAARSTMPRRLMPLLLLGLSMLGAAPSAQAADTLKVFAAASLATALETIDADYAAQNLGAVSAVYQSSSTLAKQIEAGAPADVFLSADPAWMDYLADRKLVAAGSRFDLLGNRLVLVAPVQARPNLTIAPGFPLVQALGGGRLAVGDPDHVPAGIYAKAALEKLGLWAAVEPHLARAENVRVALAYVARGETPLGIVYASDAIADPGIAVVDSFPEDSHPPIIYPVAAIAGGDTAAAANWLTYLKTSAARAVFEKNGFTMLAPLP